MLGVMVHIFAEFAWRLQLMVEEFSKPQENENSLPLPSRSAHA